MHICHVPVHSSVHTVCSSLTVKYPVCCEHQDVPADCLGLRPKLHVCLEQWRAC